MYTHLHAKPQFYNRIFKVDQDQEKCWQMRHCPPFLPTLFDLTLNPSTSRISHLLFNVYCSTVEKPCTKSTVQKCKHLPEAQILMCPCRVCGIMRICLQLTQVTFMIVCSSRKKSMFYITASLFENLLCLQIRTSHLALHIIYTAEMHGKLPGKMRILNEALGMKYSVARKAVLNSC